MTEMGGPDASVRFDFYGPQYARFHSPIAAEVRREVFGEDIGQLNWQTEAERAQVELWRSLPRAQEIWRSWRPSDKYLAASPCG